MNNKTCEEIKNKTKKERKKKEKRNSPSSIFICLYIVIFFHGFKLF